MPRRSKPTYSYLERASATVRSWPKWKQRIIGVVLPEERKAIREAHDETD